MKFLIHLYLCDLFLPSCVSTVSLFISLHNTLLLFPQLSCILCGSKKSEAGSWLPAASFTATYVPVAGGVVGQAGSQMRGQQGPSEGAHAGADLEDFPSDQHSSSRGFLCGCWCRGSTHWRFFAGRENTRHNKDYKHFIGWCFEEDTMVLFGIVGPILIVSIQCNMLRQSMPHELAERHAKVFIHSKVTRAFYHPASKDSLTLVTILLCNTLPHKKYAS